MRFALVGLGFISDRHIEAVDQVGGAITMTCDSDPGKNYRVPEASFFTDWQAMMADAAFDAVDAVVICTPNDLHVPITTAALARGKRVLCEKPPLISVADAGGLLNDPRLRVVLQLRENAQVAQLRESLRGVLPPSAELDIHIHRGDFYMQGWKGDDSRSGGLVFNIGIHYVDLLTWFFGEPQRVAVSVRTPKCVAGSMEWADSSGELTIPFRFSIEAPMDAQKRVLRIGTQTISLTRGFERLHDEVYRKFIRGEGAMLEDCLPALRTAQRLRGDQ